MHRSRRAPSFSSRRPFLTEAGSDSDSDAPESTSICLTTNIPAQPDVKADIALLELRLDQKDICVHGTARLRNIAFHKRLVACFSFDGWETRSLVSGFYVRSIDSVFDLFQFTLKLPSMNVEGKTFSLALRYEVDNKEIWDNNGGKNYQGTFVREIIKRNRGRVLSEPAPSWKNESLAERYDFKSSFKQLQAFSTSQPKQNPSRERKSNSLSPPIAQLKTLSLGSPRDMDGDSYYPTKVHPSRTPPVLYSHHQRGYFDIAGTRRSSSDPVVRSSPSGTLSPMIAPSEEISPLVSPTMASLVSLEAQAEDLDLGLHRGRQVLVQVPLYQAGNV